MTSVTEQLKSITERAKQDRAALKAFDKRFPQIFEFADAFGERDGIYSAYASYSFGGSFTVNILGLDGFRGEEFLDNLLAVEQFFQVDFTMTDVPEYNRKDFKAEIAHPHGTLHIRVEAKLRAESSECYRVVVGETRSEVITPLYKLVCPEISE